MSQPKKKTDPLLEVAELAVKELGRRLKEDPQAFPAHVLSKVTADTIRIVDRRDNEEEGVEAKPFNLRDELPTLPRARAEELLREEIARLEAELQTYKSILEELDVVPTAGERGTGPGESVSLEEGR